MTSALALITASSYAAFLLLRRNTPLLHRLAIQSVGVLDGMLSRGDEDEKLAALETATRRLMRTLLSFLILLGTGGALLCLPWLVADEVGLNAWLTWPGMLAASLGGTIAFFLPRNLPGVVSTSGHGASHYSALDQLLHRLILNHPHLHMRLMRREVATWRKRGGVPHTSFLWVTGLARAGTTSMLERLVQTKAFHSLHYGNMPLVLAPSLWKRFHNPGSGEKRERSHGDGILVGLDSAEALEEVFFQAATNRSYITPEALEAHSVDIDMHRDYLDYQGIALASSDRPQAMYVAKNNNALLRYPAMRLLNRDFHVVFMFREPLVHAASLLAMHRKYCAMQASDPFVREYMDWLAHHEFGLGHLPFRFPSSTSLPTGNKDSLDYWLDVWINHHREALAMDPHHLHFVSYESYCADPNGVLKSLGESLGVQIPVTHHKAFVNNRSPEEEAHPDHLAEALAMHAELMARSSLTRHS